MASHEDPDRLTTAERRHAERMLRRTFLITAAGALGLLVVLGLRGIDFEGGRERQRAECRQHYAIAHSAADTARTDNWIVDPSNRNPGVGLRCGELRRRGEL